MSDTITNTAAPIHELRASYRGTIVSGSADEHLAAKVALVEASTGRTLTADEIAYL